MERFFNKQTKDTNLLTKIVICSWKNYESHQLNIIRDCAQRWFDDNMMQTPKCTLDYFVIPVDLDKNHVMFCINLSEKQALAWRVDKLNLTESDIKNISVFKYLHFHDFEKFFNVINKSF